MKLKDFGTRSSTDFYLCRKICVSFPINLITLHVFSSIWWPLQELQRNKLMFYFTVIYFLVELQGFGGKGYSNLYLNGQIVGFSN